MSRVIYYIYCTSRRNLKLKTNMENRYVTVLFFMQSIKGTTLYSVYMQRIEQKFIRLGGRMPHFLNLFFFCTNRYIHLSLIHSFINIRWGSSLHLHSCGLSGRNLQSFTAGITGRNLNFCIPVNYTKKTTTVQSSASLLHGSTVY